jgi:hypothetical protein
MRLAFLALALAACATHDEHHLETYWSIDRYDVFNPESIACPQGWTTARVVNVDPTTGQRFVDEFPCEDGAGVTSYLPGDTYLSSIEIVAADGKLLASSPPQLEEVTSFNPLLTANIFIDAGYADASWTPCADPTEQLDVRLDLDGPAQVATFINCAVGNIVSPAVPPGTYTATIWDRERLVKTFDGVVVQQQNRVTHLGEVSLH